MPHPLPVTTRRKAEGPADIVAREGRNVVALAMAVSTRQTLHGLWLVLRGKRVRGWNLLYRTAVLNPAYYDRWVEVGEPHAVREYCATAWPRGAPSIGCVVLARDDIAAAGQTLRSIRAAFGPGVQVWSDDATLAPDGAAFIEPGTALSEAPWNVDPAPDWLLILRAGDLLSPDLGAVLERTQLDPDDRPIVFWDEDAVHGARRQDPWIKPDWDPILFRARDGVTGAGLIATQALRRATHGLDASWIDPAGIASSVARLLAEDTVAPLHIPLILTHRAHGTPFVAPAQHRAVLESWPSAFVPAMPTRWPTVSIIIPTRDRAGLLETCLAALGRLDYPGAAELLIIDNDSVEPATQVLFARSRQDGATILSHPGPFNFAALVNHAVGATTGEILCLLNNDVEALDGAWLTEMVRYAVLPRVGAVGARLLYPDGTIQHAGVAIGVGGAAGHVQKGIDPTDPRFADWHAHSRIVSAVTGACLVVERDKFVAAGGMDAETFAIDFNDVDLCLRLQALGLANILAVEATMVHQESKSRGTPASPESAARFGEELAQLRARWNTRDVADPHYSPRFRRECEQCILAF